jgi:hypothetical protein
MIVGMRTVKQATEVSELTGRVQLPGKPRQDGTVPASRYVDIGEDFEVHRAAVESVSVLFDLFSGDVTGYAASGSPGEKLPTGWLVTGAKFEVEWPADEDRRALVRSHFGARRFAFNWGLAADRWFPSSQIHHGHTQPDGRPCRLIGRGRVDKKLVCPQTGEVVDRDRNAALNLRDWPDHASCGPVATTAPSVPGPTGPSVGTGHGADAGSSGAGGASASPASGEAGSGEARTQTPQGDA